MRIKTLIILTLVLISVVLLASCSQAETPTPAVPPPPQATTGSAPVAAPPSPSLPATVPSGMAARVNGQPVPLEAYQRQVAQFEAALRAQGSDLNSAEGLETLKQVRRQVLEAMIDQILIEQGAAAQGIQIPESEVAGHVEKSIEEGGGRDRFLQWLQANAISEEEYRNTVRTQLLTDALIDQITADLPNTVPQVRLRQILVTDMEQATQLRQRLQRGESFEALAERFSVDDGSRQQGGDLGWFPQGFSLLPPEVEEAAFSLKMGETSAIIKAPYGYYIIQVIEQDPARPLSVEMKQSLRQQRFLEWLDHQRQGGQIERFVDTE